MGEQYAGDDTVFPEDFTIPDDGDDEDASSVDVALEALGDRTAYLKEHSPRLQTAEFTTPGTHNWTAPARVTRVRARGVGGGGSGGAGTFGSLAGDGGGSGGGGARQGEGEVEVVPGDVYVVTVAAGGASPPSNTSGNDGEDSSFAGVTTLTFYGAGGGGKGTDPSGDNYGRGGPAIRNGAAFAAQAALGPAPEEGVGGWSYTGSGGPVPAAPYRTGGHSPVARGGAPGTDNHPTLGAFGGGGGGASGYAGNVPGVGGAGGSAAGSPGTAGTLGSGGGGGGGAISANPGGAGGAGGDGAITLSWTEDT